MGALRVLAACFTRDYRIERSYRLALALGVAADLAALALFFYLSKLFTPTRQSDPELAQGYFQYAIVGLGITRVLETLLNSIPGRVRQDQLTGALEAVLATPVRPGVVALGYGLYDLVRAIVGTVVFFALAIVVFGAHLEISTGRVAAALFGFASIVVMFGAAGVAAAGMIIAFKRGQVVIGVAVTAVTLLGTAYFPASTLPGILRFVAEVNPLTWALSLMRPLTTGAAVPWDRAVLLIPTCALAAVGAVALVRLGVREAKRRGTIGHY